MNNITIMQCPYHVAMCKMFNCALQEGKTEVVANDAGDRVTPAMVAFTDHDKVLFVIYSICVCK